MRSLLLAAVIVVACRSAPAVAPAPTPPLVAPSPPPPPMTRAEARAVLRALSPTDRATLDELWFMYELQDAHGNDGYPSRMLHRLEREFANPVVADREAMRAALAEARHKLATLPDGTAGQDYEKSNQIVAPVLGVVLPPGEALDRILDQPDDVALAWLVEQYHRPDHFHPYNMQNRVFMLVVETYGERALPVIEHRLREAQPLGPRHFLGSYWEDATRAAQRLLGRRFGAWYFRVRQAHYGDDLTRQLQAD